MRILVILSLFRVAWRNLARNRRRTAFTIAALAVGVMAVVFVRGFIGGLQESLITTATQGGLGSLQIRAAGQQTSLDSDLSHPIHIDDDLRKNILSVVGITGLSAHLQTLASIGDDAGDPTFTTLIAVDALDELQVSPKRAYHLPLGKWLPKAEDDKRDPDIDPSLQTIPAVLSSELADLLHLQKENDSTVLFAVDGKGQNHMQPIRLQGHLAAGAMGEKNQILIPLADAWRLLDCERCATQIIVAVSLDADLSAVAAQLRHVLDQKYPNTYEITTWIDVAPFAAEVKDLQDRGLGVLSAVLIIVVLIGIANTMLLSSLERVREIGTLLAIGAQRWQVRFLFLGEGVLLGFVGAGLGAFLGSLLVYVLSLQGIPLTMPGASVPQMIYPVVQPIFLFQIVILSAVGAILSSFYPAYKSSNLSPVAALSST